jgi:hypothetical protein
MKRVVLSLLIAHALGSYFVFVPWVVWSELVRRDGNWESPVFAAMSGLFAPLVFPVLMVRATTDAARAGASPPAFYWISLAVYALVFSAWMWRSRQRRRR